MGLLLHAGHGSPRSIRPISGDEQWVRRGPDENESETSSPWHGARLRSVVVRGVVETVLPARMGTPFRWLVGSAWVGNLGDGIALAAGPLLVAAQTSDPLLVALAGLLQRLPWLAFGLYAGVLADRVTRRALVVAVDLMRTAVLVVLTAALVTGTANVPVV